MKYLFIAALLLLHTTRSFAQSGCGIAATDQALRASNPVYDALRHKADSLIDNVSAANQSTPSGSSGLVVGGVHYIPVVVHVIHSGEAIGSTQNPSDQTIINYIAMLNQAFAGTYPGYPGPGTGGQNIGIQFALAQRAPDCSPTNGIVRRNALDWLTPDKANTWTTFGVNQAGGAIPFGLSFDDIAAMSNWSNLDYYNIYMVRKITGSNYAYYPTGAATIYDATVLSMLAVTGTAVSPYVVTHELGHAFGLRHTFEGTSGTTCPPNANCLTDGDKICDTDPHIDNISACNPTAINPCTGQPFGNIGHNYMFGGCGADHFTAGQKAYMNNVLATLRWTLDTSLGGTSLALSPPSPASNTPTISIATPQTSYCINSQVIFTATTTFAGATPTYQWKVNGVNAGANSPVFTTTTLTNGAVVTCQLTSSYGATCVTTNTATSNSITISVSSTIAPSLTITTPNITACASTQVSITAVLSNPGPSVPFFQWYVNGFPYGSPTGSGSATSTFSYVPSNGDVVTCKAMASTPCTASPWHLSNNAVTITLTPSIAPSITITASDTTLCAGSTVTFNATYTNGGTVTPTIYWNVVNYMGGSVGSGPGPITLPADTSFDISVILFVNNTGGACYYSTATAATLHITVDTALPATIVISTPDTTFCHGSTINFTAATSLGGTNPAYDWIVNGVSAGVGTTTFSHAPDDGDVIKCKLTSNAPCVTVNPVMSNTITVHEFDTVAAQMTLLQGSSTMCEGDTLILIADYNNLGTNTIIGRQWKVNGSLASSTDTLKHIVVPGNNEIVFTTSFQQIPHCMTSSVVEYFRDTVTGIALPAPPVITDMGTHLSSSYPNGQNQWYEVNAGIIAGQTGQQFTPSFSGYFYAVATVNGCSSKPSDTIHTIVNSVGELPSHEQGFYPNPSSTGQFFTPSHLVGLEATITNSVGAVVQKGKLDKQVSLRNVAPGVYFVRVVNSKVSRSYQLVISK